MDQTVKLKELEEINRPLLRAWWIERAMGIVIVSLVFAVLAEASVIAWMLPLKEIKHSLITGYNKDTQVIKVEPIEKSLSGWNKLMEIYSKQFVIDLHTIDGQTETIRLKKLSLMANEESLDYIENQLNMNNQNCIAKKIFEAGITRSVIIKRVTNLAPDAPNTWQVEWEVKEQDHEKEIQRSHRFISTLMAETTERIMNSGEEDLNPIGYTVIKYTLRMIE